MKEKYIRYQIETIVNQELYEQKIIPEETYRQTQAKLVKLVGQLKEYNFDFI